MVSVQGLRKGLTERALELGTSFPHPVSVLLPAETGTRKGKEFCCLPDAGNPPIPYRQAASGHCTRKTACEIGRKRGFEN